MNRKALIIFIVAMITFFPKTSRADVDTLSIIQDYVTSATEKVNYIVKQYNNIQSNLQELSLNRDIISQIKDGVKADLKARAMQFWGDAQDVPLADSMTFLKSSLNSVSFPGVDQYINMGDAVNPQLTVAIGETYLKKRHRQNDMQEIIAQDERNNNLMVDNLAILFANSLVHRKQIIDDDPCSCVAEGTKDCSKQKSACEKKNEELNSLKDVSSVKEKYYETMTNAHYRWFKIKEVMAQYAKMKGEGLMNQGNQDDVSATTGAIEEAQEDKEKENFERNIRCVRCKAENDALRRAGKQVKSCAGVCS